MLYPNLSLVQFESLGSEGQLLLQRSQRALEDALLLLQLLDHQQLGINL